MPQSVPCPLRGHRSDTDGLGVLGLRVLPPCPWGSLTGVAAGLLGQLWELCRAVLSTGVVQVPW